MGMAAAPVRAHQVGGHIADRLTASSDAVGRNVKTHPGGKEELQVHFCRGAGDMFFSRRDRLAAPHHRPRKSDVPDISEKGSNELTTYEANTF
jgi:hypothetical protein